MKLTVIIPVYNERNTIERLLDKVRIITLGKLQKEIIVVDDSSTNGTERILKRASQNGIKVISHDRNRGKGAAILTGIRQATGDIVIIQDADLEYDPRDYPTLVRPIIDGESDVVYGRRTLRKSNFSYRRYWLGNKLLSWIGNLLYNTKITDWHSGYKAFRRDVLANIELECERFDFTPEVTAKLSKRGYKIREVPISYRPRTIEEGKKIRVRDGLSDILTLIRYRIFS